MTPPGRIPTGAGSLPIPRRRAGEIASVMIVAGLGWLILSRMISRQAGLEGGYEALGPGAASPAEQLWLALAMWNVMAVAMMLPIAMPMISAFGDIQNTAGAKGQLPVPRWMFAAGYLCIWGALASIAATLQWGLGLVMTETPGPAKTLAGGGLLVLAGLYQWSALKSACLGQCRSPMRFFIVYWRDGRMGALRMGSRHGIFCVGCCWALMALMFVGGVMNLAWMAVLTVIMLVERVLPRGDVFGRGVGVFFVAWGIALAAYGFV